MQVKHIGIQPIKYSFEFSCPTQPADITYFDAGNISRTSRLQLEDCIRIAMFTHNSNLVAHGRLSAG